MVAWCFEDFLLRHSKQNNTTARSARSAIPPTTPPTIAPMEVFDLRDPVLLVLPGAGVTVMVVNDPAEPEDEVALVEEIDVARIRVN